MDTKALYAALPDLSARIMRNALVNDFNLDWSAFCRNSSLRPVLLDDLASELLVQEEILLQQGFADFTANAPTIWFDIGLRYRSIKYGSLGLAMMTAGTLGEALQIACRYQSLTYSLINYHYVPNTNGACALVGSWSGSFLNLHDFTEHRDLGAIRTLVADLMGGNLPLERVTVRAAPPHNWSELRKYFPCPVEFDADQTQWIFKPGAANLPLPLADNELLSLYCSRCDRALDRTKPSGLIRDRLAERLIRSDGSSLSAVEAAHLFALSERTLHRRLAEEGTRFSTLVDDARYARARELLLDRRNTIEIVAFALGYAEPSSFSRAFKRWAGVGALEYRRQKLGLEIGH
ncbi:AraC family transcriptional regulator [Polymorphobacter multimanifer]|uniref:AraC-like DNA-binding protein n=1 Tax=Polymorphobacter multimanifer TaxID=1070431 RepID=A0A841LD87_9SPHN|nr:AraC family transcriptional regulator [Polymorphobacter multimanifer]MBB6228963.1 AraC-like DNA-binding protein [Polymorphobacter multimanifer]GGI73746.1 AraC family transcriptional regulator [Polymorphobacter multimanifer]